MYLSYYNLEKKPFQISTDPEFLWFGEKHKEALATLKYGILDNKGFLMLTGDVGTGKTTLINALVRSLGDEVVVARVPDPGMESMDLMNFICHAFRIGKEFVRKDLFLVHFSHFLNTAYTRKKKTLLVIDEAQRLSPKMLEEVRQLSNIEREDCKLLNIFLIGQNEFNDMLREGKNEALLQRITLNYHLKPMDLHETGSLIKHRLRVAGGGPSLFNPESIREIFACTGGIPRRINVLCDHCLISGFVRDKSIIDSETVLIAAEELKLPSRERIKPIELTGGGDVSKVAISGKYELQDFPEVIEVEELLVGSEAEEEVVMPNHRSWSSWAWRSAVALSLVGMIGGFVNMSSGNDDPAYQIKQAVLQLIDKPVSRPQALPAKQKVFKNTVSSVVQVRESVATKESSGTLETIIVQPVTSISVVERTGGESDSVQIIDNVAAAAESARGRELQQVSYTEPHVEDSKKSLPVNDELDMPAGINTSRTTYANTEPEVLPELTDVPQLTITTTVNPENESVEVIDKQVTQLAAEHTGSNDSTSLEFGSAKSQIDLQQAADTTSISEQTVLPEIADDITTNTGIEEAAELSLAEDAETVSAEIDKVEVTFAAEPFTPDEFKSQPEDLLLEKISIPSDSIDLELMVEKTPEFEKDAIETLIIKKHEQVIMADSRQSEVEVVKTALVDLDEGSSQDKPEEVTAPDSGKVIDWLLKKKGKK